MNKSAKEIQENTNKQLKETKKSLQNLKMEIESISEAQTKGILEMKDSGIQTGGTGASFTNRI
jgi:hypothetical protein